MQISVIIPTCGRISELALCLEGLRRQTLKPKEIIVVNDSGENISDKLKDIKVVTTKGKIGSGRAKNEGVKLAQGQVLAFLDDDCVPSRLWLAEIAKSFQDKKIKVVVGRIVEKYPQDKQGSFSDFILNLPFYPFYLLFHKKVGGTIYFNGRVDAHLNTSSQGFCDWGGAGNLAVRTLIFQRIGGFEENFLPGPSLEEPDLCFRIKKKGGRIFYNGRAEVIHYRSPKGRLTRQDAIQNTRANEVYFGLKNIAFQNLFTFLGFFIYQAWQIFIYGLAALVQREYWQRIRGKIKGFAHYRKVISKK